MRAEYHEIPDAVFRPARAEILAGLLAAPTLFRTLWARARFESAARATVTAEVADLARSPAPSRGELIRGAPRWAELCRGEPHRKSGSAPMR